MNSVATRFRADVNHGISCTFGARKKQLFAFGDAHGQHVDQRIMGIARLELNLSADRRHAKAVSVERDAADDSIENSPVARRIFFTNSGRSERAKTQGIEHRNGARAHGENVAQNSAYTGCCTLKRLDKARVIVRLDLENGH